MKVTRRAAVSASGAAALGLAGCTSEGSTRQPATTGASRTTATEPAAPGPDGVALGRALSLTGSLLAALEASRPALDPGGRLVALHVAHRAVLHEVTGTATSATEPAVPPARRLTTGRLRRRELGAQRELARLAEAAESGAVSRLLASMSAGIAAHVADLGEVSR